MSSAFACTARKILALSFPFLRTTHSLTCECSL